MRHRDVMRGCSLAGSERVLLPALSEGGTNAKLDYYPGTDNLYLEFKAGPGADTIEVTDGLNVDIDANGEVVGFDIDQASRRLDLHTLETGALPLHSVKAG